MKTNPIALSAFAATLACAPLAAFEKIALIDSFDFGTVFDTETVAGTEQILDHVLLTGADTVLWRNCGGATMRYQSQEESPLLMEAGATGRSARGTSRIRSSGAATRAAFRGTDAARSPSPR